MLRERATWCWPTASCDRAGWPLSTAPTWPLRHGNHAFAAIPVTKGRHTVELRYVAPGLESGLVVTLVSLSLAAVLVVAPFLLRRRRGAFR